MSFGSQRRRRLKIQRVAQPMAALVRQNTSIKSFKKRSSGNEAAKRMIEGQFCLVMLALLSYSLLRLEINVQAPLRSRQVAWSSDTRTLSRRSCVSLPGEGLKNPRHICEGHSEEEKKNRHKLHSKVTVTALKRKIPRARTISIEQLLRSTERAVCPTELLKSEESAVAVDALLFRCDISFKGKRNDWQNKLYFQTSQKKVLPKGTYETLEKICCLPRTTMHAPKLTRTHGLLV